MKQLKLKNLKDKNHYRIVDRVIGLTEHMFSADEGYTSLKTSNEYEKLRNKEIHKLVKILNKEIKNEKI